MSNSLESKIIAKEIVNYCKENNCFEKLLDLYATENPDMFIDFVHHIVTAKFEFVRDENIRDVYNILAWHSTCLGIKDELKKLGKDDKMFPNELTEKERTIFSEWHKNKRKESE